MTRYLKFLAIPLLALAALILAPKLAEPQSVYNGQPGGVVTVVSALGNYATKGTIVVVTDGTGSTDCTTGGGSTVLACIYSGSAWLAVSTYALTPPSVSIDTTTPVTVSAGNFVEFYNNQNATAATAVTYDLPTAAAGKQFCFTNSNNGSAADTGALTLQTSATGQYIIDASGVLSASDGYVVSSGAAADAACVVGVDSTHWALYIQRGTWTTH